MRELEKKRFAQKFTDGRTDDGRLAIALAHSHTKISDVDELKLRIISEWAALSHTAIDSAVAEWRQRLPSIGLHACVRAGGGHFEQRLK